MVRREMPPWQTVFDDLSSYVDKRLQLTAPAKNISDMEMAV
jgi:hypothetical protein